MSTTKQEKEELLEKVIQKVIESFIEDEARKGQEINPTVLLGNSSSENTFGIFSSFNFILSLTKGNISQALELLKMGLDKIKDEDNLNFIEVSTKGLEKKKASDLKFDTSIIILEGSSMTVNANQSEEVTAMLDGATSLEELEKVKQMAEENREIIIIEIENKELGTRVILYDKIYAEVDRTGVFVISDKPVHDSGYMKP